MKKMLAFLCVMLTLCSFTFAAKKKKAKKKKEAAPVVQPIIPEGRKLFVGAWDLILREGDADYIKIDPQTDEYIFRSYNVVGKNVLNLSMQKYKVTIKGEGDKFSVEGSEYESYPIDENGNPKETKLNLPKFMTTPNYKSIYKQIKEAWTDGIAKNLANWTAEEYEAKLNNTVANPIFLQTLKDSNSMLYYKKFVADNAIVGRTLEFPIELQNLDESKREGYKYVATAGYHTKQGAYKTMLFVIYSNNDEWLNIKNGVEYMLKGKIEELDMTSTGDISMVILED